MKKVYFSKIEKQRILWFLLKHIFHNSQYRNITFEHHSGGGIGVATDIKYVCGTTEDITDYSSW